MVLWHCNLSYSSVFAYDASLPALQFGFQFWKLAAVEGGRGDALALLLPIVVEEAEGILAQEEYGNEVAGGEEGHAEVDDTPYRVEGDESTEDDHHAAGAEAVEGEDAGATRHESDISLAIIVVADNAGIGEEEDGHGDKDAAPRTDLALEGNLCEDDAVQLRVFIDTADKDDERSAGTDDEGVGEDTEGLDEALLNGMRDGGGSGSIGGTAFAGLVGKETTLDAIHDGGTNGTADGLMQSERTIDDKT